MLKLADRWFVRYASDLRRGSFIIMPSGQHAVVVTPQLAQVYGLVRVLTDAVPNDLRWRQFMADRARHRRLPARERYNPLLDPRLRSDEWQDTSVVVAPKDHNEA